MVFYLWRWYNGIAVSFVSLGSRDLSSVRISAGKQVGGSAEDLALS